MYALKLDSTNRILSATLAEYAPSGAVFVDSLPNGDIYDYIYDGEYRYSPIESDTLETDSPALDKFKIPDYVNLFASLPVAQITADSGSDEQKKALVTTFLPNDAMGKTLSEDESGDSGLVKYNIYLTAKKGEMECYLDKLLVYVESSDIPRVQVWTTISGSSVKHSQLTLQNGWNIIPCGFDFDEEHITKVRLLFYTTKTYGQVGSFIVRALRGVGDMFRKSHSAQKFIGVATENANAFKGHIKGVNGAYIDDISPIEHTLDVKVRSKNILDVENATVWTRAPRASIDLLTAERYGNGIKLTCNESSDQSWETGGFTLGLTKDFLGKTLTLSFGNVSFSMQSGNHKTCILFGICKHDDYYMGGLSNMINVSTVSNANVLTVTIPADTDYETYPYLRIAFYINSGGAVSVGDYAIYEDIMVEEGAVSEPMYTEYVNVGDTKVDVLGKNILDSANATIWTEAPGTWNDYLKAERYGNGIKLTALDESTQSWARGGLTLGLTKDFLGKTLTLSFGNVSYSMQSGNHKTALFFVNCKHNNYYLNGLENLKAVSTVAVGTNVVTATIPADTDYETYPYLRIAFYINNGGVVSVDDYAIYEDIMVEVNDTATEYEPYIESTTYTSNADGTVDDITSVYPTTTIISDISGVVIEAQYNKDANKVVASLEEKIATLTAAIISLGGNI